MAASSRSEFELRACASPKDLISRLNFSDESELLEGKESAGPNEDLDADFSPRYMSVVGYVTSSTGTTDDIPQQLQAMLDDVKSVATSANTNVYKAADILETIGDAIQYGRDAAKDHFNLDGKARLSLNSFDKSFKQFLQDRMSSEVELADQELASCKRHVEEAIGFARTNADRQKERDAREDELVSLKGLEETHETAVQDISEDEKDLTTIMKKCSSDILSIDTSLVDRESVMTKVQADITRKKTKRDNELLQNRRRQDELSEELRKLEEREAELVRQNEEEASKQKGFENEYQGVVEDITQWKAKIEQLHKQAQASLKIIVTMREFTSLVMEDSKRRKKEWKIKLADMELTNCLQVRDTLMAMASIHLMETDDCKSTIAVINNQISRNKEEKKSLALTGYKEGVHEAEARLKQLQDRFEEYKNRMKEHEERVATLESELTKTDERIHQLKPNLRLDSLEERYSKRRKGIDLVFKQDHIDAATFCSHGSYET